MLVSTAASSTGTLPELDRNASAGGRCDVSALLAELPRVQDDRNRLRARPRRATPPVRAKEPVSAEHARPQSDLDRLDDVTGMQFRGGEAV